MHKLMPLIKPSGIRPCLVRAHIITIQANNMFSSGHCNCSLLSIYYLCLNNLNLGLKNVTNINEYHVNYAYIYTIQNQSTYLFLFYDRDLRNE